MVLSFRPAAEENAHLRLCITAPTAVGFTSVTAETVTDILVLTLSTISVLTERSSIRIMLTQMTLKITTITYGEIFWE
jgi:hypothetical protein